jgi:hypothetical protein
MQLSSVHLARAFLFLESNDLNPRGATFLPDIIRALAERYRFQKVPGKMDELDENKGVEFVLGYSGNTTIDKAVLYAKGIALDTRATTQESEAILEEILTWASEKFGLHYRREMVLRRGYVSNLAFYSDVPLLSVNPILDDFAERVGKIVSGNLKLDCRYEPSTVMISMDPESQRVPASPFSIERRVGTAFSEGKYFSAAPVHTDVHIKLVEEYERSVATQQSVRR